MNAFIEMFANIRFFIDVITAHSLSDELDCTCLYASQHVFGHIHVNENLKCIRS
jgi:hypothetical protein